MRNETSRGLNPGHVRPHIATTSVRLAGNRGFTHHCATAVYCGQQHLTNAIRVVRFFVTLLRDGSSRRRCRRQRTIIGACAPLLHAQSGNPRCEDTAQGFCSVTGDQQVASNTFVKAQTFCAAPRPVLNHCRHHTSTHMSGRSNPKFSGIRHTIYWHCSS